MRNLLCAILSVLLSSCILTQEAPNTDNPTGEGPQILGIVGIVDLLKPTGSGGFFEAGFLKKEDRAVQSGQSDFLFLEHSFRFNRQSQCEVYKSDRSSRAGLIAAGKITFGISSWMTYVAEQDQDHLYSASFDPNFPSGRCTVQVEGTSEVPGFVAELLVPEPLRGVKANGVALTAPEITLQKFANLNLSWDEAQFPHEKSVMVFALSIPRSNFDLRCSVKEADLVKSDKQVQWRIDKSELVQVPLVSDATVSVFRALVMLGKGKRIEVELQGSRVHSTNARVEGF